MADEPAMGPCDVVVIVAPPPGNRRAARVVAAYRAVRARQRRLEIWLERRYPTLYDARHAATGIGRAVWPLLGPLLAALILLPVVALLAGLVALLGLTAPSIDLPAVDLPEIPFPNITAPSWLRAIGDAVGAVLSVLGDVAKYLLLAGAVVLGVHRTREVRHKRTAAEQVGRSELLRRLAIGLSAVEARARSQAATTVGDTSDGRAEPE